jgi:hypothetical protein
VPSIQMYLDTADLPLLQDYLNAEIEIAVIARASAGYALVKPVTLEPNAQYTLWHLPSGDIPGDCLDADGNIVADPWAKWHLGAIHLQLEVRPGKYQTFVPRSSGVGFDLATFDDPSALGRSDFEWVGNKYSVIGKPAHPATDRWWKRLRRWVGRNSTKVASYGALNNLDSVLDVWAFPAAYAALSAGKPRSMNPSLCFAKGEGVRLTNG